MGYYIETEFPRDKAGQLLALYHPDDCQQVDRPVWPPPKDKLLICVVQNGMFDAAAICFDREEFDHFQPTPRDQRPRTWLLMDKELVLTLNPTVKDRL